MTMPSIIYYDLEVLSPEVLQAARREAAAHAIEAAPRDMAAAHQIEALVTLANARGFDNRDRLMAWIDQVFGGLGRAGLSESSAWNPHGVSLLEIGRYHVELAIQAREHRRWVLHELQTRFSARKVLWVWAGRHPRAHDEIRALVDHGTAVGIDVRPHRVGSATRASVLGSLRSYAATRLKPLSRSLLAGARRTSVTSSPVVFAEYFPNSVHALIPVATTLGRSDNITPTWLAGRQPVRAALAGKGIESVLLEECARPHRVLHAATTGTIVQALRPCFEALPQHLFGGTDAARAFLRSATLWALVDAARESHWWFAMYRDALSLLRPQVLVSTTYSSVPGRAAAAAASTVGAQSVYVQHGIVPAHRVFAYFLHDIKLVWGEHERQLLESVGRPGSAIACGATLYDDLQAKAKAGAPASSNGTAPHVAFFASRTGGMVVNEAMASEYLRAVCDAIETIPGARLTVKIHPSDTTGIPQRIVAKWPDVRLIETGSASDLILSSDIVIVVSSTTGLEACVAGRPLISFDLSGSFRDTDYVRHGAAVPVSRAEDLAETIRLVCTDAATRARLATGRRKLLDYMLNGANGNAARLVADRISSLLHTTRHSS